MSRQARETEGWRVMGPPLSRPHVKHVSYTIYMIISYADISGNKNTHSLTLHPHTVAQTLTHRVWKVQFPAFIDVSE